MVNWDNAFPIYLSVHIYRYFHPKGWTNQRAQVIHTVPKIYSIGILVQPVFLVSRLGIIRIE